MADAPKTTSATRSTRAAARAARAAIAPTETTPSVQAPIPSTSASEAPSAPPPSTSGAPPPSSQARPGVHQSLPPTVPQAPSASTSKETVAFTYDERLAHYGLVKLTEGLYQKTTFEHRSGTTRQFKATAENLKALKLIEVSKGLYITEERQARQTRGASASAAGSLAEMAPTGFEAPDVQPPAAPAYSEGTTDSPQHVPFSELIT